MSQCGWQAVGSSLCLATGTTGNALLVRKCYSQRILLLVRRKLDVPSMWYGTTGPPWPASASQPRFLFLEKAGGAAVQKRGSLLRRGSPPWEQAVLTASAVQSLAGPSCQDPLPTFLSPTGYIAGMSKVLAPFMGYSSSGFIFPTLSDESLKYSTK